MTGINLSEKSINEMKRQAKRQRKARGITHSAALDEQAAQYGFRNWALLMKAHNKEAQNG